MRGVRCEFYADSADLADLLKHLEQVGDFKYVQCRSVLNGTNAIYRDALDILQEAIVTPEKAHRRHSFLIVPDNEEVLPREISLADGSGIISIVDQGCNWNSVAVAFGGDAGDQTLVMSDMSTIGDTYTAREIHKRIKKLVRAKANRFGPKGAPSYLMRGAMQKAKLGWRLTRGKSYAPSQDARISSDEIASM